MEIPRNKPYLIDLVNTLGIQDTVEYRTNAKGGDKTRKEDYAVAIQKYFLVKRYGSLENVPKHMQLALKYAPQKACPRNQLRPASKQKELWASVWNDINYIAEEKLDGFRFVMIYIKEEGFHCYSKHIDANELLPIEYTNNFYTKFDPSKLVGVDSFMIDSELICPNHNLCVLLGNNGQVAETQLAAVAALMQMNSEDSIRLQRDEGVIVTPVVFDWLMLNGEMIINQKLWERKAILRKYAPVLQKAHLQIEEHKAYRLSKEKKHVLYDNIINRGGEGLIVKHLDSVYSPDKRINDWVKIKRTVGGVLGDTLSGYITGFKVGEKGSGFENLIGSLEISSNVTLNNEEVEVRSIAWVKSFPLSLRQKMTRYDSSGYPILNPEYLGRVMDVDGQCFSSRSQHIVHAQFKGWRPDLTEFHCTILEETIERLIV